MKPTYKQIWLITYPILISLLMENLIGLTDTAFLGRVGEVELGASALAGSLLHGYFHDRVRVQHRSADSDRTAERRKSIRGYRPAAATRHPVPVAAGRRHVRRLADVHAGCATPDHRLRPVCDAAISYTNWRVYGFFFSFVAVMFRAFYVGTTNTKILTANSVTMVLTNVALNYALIFGKFGLPAMGIAGAAIASSASELASALFFILYSWLKTDHRKYGLFRFARPRPRLLGRMLNVSVWTMLQSFVSVATWFLFFLAVEHLGERPLAVSNIVRSISGIIFMAVSAFASTASSLVSNQMGAGQQTLVMPTVRRIVGMCYLTIAPAALLFALFPTAVLRIYTDSIPLIDSSVSSLWVMLSAYLLTVPAIILFNTVSGTGNTRSALALEMTTLLIYILYTLYVVIYLRADVAVCWTTEHVYAIVMLLLASRYLKKADWQHKKI